MPSTPTSLQQRRLFADEDRFLPLGMGYSTEKNSESKFQFSEEMTRRSPLSIASLWNCAVNILKSISTGNDWLIFFKMALSLFIVSHLCLYTVSFIGSPHVRWIGSPHVSSRELVPGGLLAVLKPQRSNWGAIIVVWLCKGFTFGFEFITIPGSCNCGLEY